MSCAESAVNPSHYACLCPEGVCAMHGRWLPIYRKGSTCKHLECFPGTRRGNDPVTTGGTKRLTLPLHRDLLPTEVFLGDHSGCF